MLSIITIVFNGASDIEATIQSVISQPDVQLQYIIIDGGSTDGTQEIITKYLEHIDYFVSERDQGIFDAINKGIKRARYPVVGLIHCGDLYNPNALSKVWSTFKQTNADVIYGDIVIRERIADELVDHIAYSNHRFLLSKMSIFHPSTFVSKDIYTKVGLYDTSYRSAADYDFFLKLFLESMRFHKIDQPLAVFNAEGLSSTNIKLSMSENFLIRIKRLGKVPAYKYWIKRSFENFYFSKRQRIFIAIFGQKTFERLKKQRK